MRSFTEYLIKRFTGEGAHTLYARFKKMILAAVEKDVIHKNPYTVVSIKKYIRAVDSLKQAVIGSMPPLKID